MRMISSYDLFLPPSAMTPPPRHSDTHTLRYLKRPVLLLAITLLLSSCNGSSHLAETTLDSGQEMVLFDGSSVEGWRMIGPGTFELQPDGSLLTRGGMGLFYYAARLFRDFELTLEWKAESDSSNSGVFVRFPETDDPAVAFEKGHEIQIDDSGAPNVRTGAIVDTSSSWRLASRPAGEWNEMRVRVAGQRYQIWVNGEMVNDFVSNQAREGHIGLQNRGPDHLVWFRNVRVTPLPAAAIEAPESLADLFAVEGQQEPISVLVITATHGFRHEEAIPASLRVLDQLSLTTEFEFDVTEDLSVLDPQLLEPYDLIFFNNSTLRVNGGESGAPVTESQRQAILDFLADGKGIVGAHAAADAFYEWDEYREMLGGGLFEEHPWTQSVHVVIEEPDNPAVAHWGDGFWIRDEIYVLDENPRWNSKVLASLDMKSVGVDPGPADFTRNDYPISWIREHNGGRVFYTKLGHFADVWTNPGFIQHLLQGMRIAAGRLDADFGGHRVKDVIAEDVWPDDIAIDERGNVWIAELRGRIHHYDAATSETRVIAELETTDPTNIEHGLYGLEVDPEFYDGKPYVYLYYAEPETFINTLSRFEYRNGTLDLSTEKVLLRVPTEPFCCHQAGDLEWGPDSTLYLSTGDTGQSTVEPTWRVSEERLEAFKERNDLKDYNWVRLADSERSAQNLQDLRGKILRINRDGTIPKDNPFYGRPGVRWEIYAYGLRNPYRFKIDPETNHLYMGVVGPDGPTDYDEYNVSLQGGENFGWPRETGRLLFNEWTPEDIPDWSPSMWEYTYEGGGRSATVGAFYRSDGAYAFPHQFQDKLFIFDWSRRWIKWADVVDDEWVADSAASVRANPVAHRIPAKRLKNIKTFDMLWETQPISMEVAPDGSIYVAEFTGFWDAAPGARVTRYRWVRD